MRLSNDITYTTSPAMKEVHQRMGNQSIGQKLHEEGNLVYQTSKARKAALHKNQAFLNEIGATEVQALTRNAKSHYYGPPKSLFIKLHGALSSVDSSEIGWEETLDNLESEMGIKSSRPTGWNYRKGPAPSDFDSPVNASKIIGYGLTISEGVAKASEYQTRNLSKSSNIPSFDEGILSKVTTNASTKLAQLGTGIWLLEAKEYYSTGNFYEGNASMVSFGGSLTGVWVGGQVGTYIAGPIGGIALGTILGVAGAIYPEKVYRLMPQLELAQLGVESYSILLQDVPYIYKESSIAPIPEFPYSSTSNLFK